MANVTTTASPAKKAMPAYADADSEVLVAEIRSPIKKQDSLRFAGSRETETTTRKTFAPLQGERPASARRPDNIVSEGDLVRATTTKETFTPVKGERAESARRPDNIVSEGERDKSTTTKQAYKPFVFATPSAATNQTFSVESTAAGATSTGGDVEYVDIKPIKLEVAHI